MPSYPPSPGPDKAPMHTPVNKFDYVTKLVTQHEQQVTQQSIQLAELTRKTVELEQKQVVELSLLTTLRDRNVLPELDGYRRDIESVRQQLDALQTRLQDEAAHDTKALALGLLQGEVKKLKEQVSELSSWQTNIKDHVQQVVHASMSEVRASLFDSLRQELMSVAADVRQEIATVRSESSAAATTVEAATLTTNSLAIKLRQHLQATGVALNSMSARIDSNTNTLDTLTNDVRTLEADSKKIKKHVVRIEKHVEGLQALGHVAMNTDKVLGELRREVEEAVGSNKTLRSDVQGASSQLQAVTQQLRQLEAEGATTQQLARGTYSELGAMAESLHATLRQMSDAQRRAAANPPSVLSSLLGPLTSTGSLAGAYTGSSVLGAGRLGLQGYAGHALAMSSAPRPVDTQGFDQNTVTTEPFDRFLTTFRARTQTHQHQQYQQSSQQDMRGASHDPVEAGDATKGRKQWSRSGHGRGIVPG